MLVLAALALLASSAMAAEVPKVELSVGYGFLHDSDLGESLPAGWYASVCGNVTNAVGIVADFGGNYKTVGVAGVAEVSVNIHSFQGGLRFSSYRSAVTPYLQVLAGGTRFSAEGSAFGFSASESTTKFSLQPGVGFTFRLSDSVGLGIGGDYRAIFADGDTVNEFRFTAGLTFRSGSR
jgi:opacity protein-like surface antigen